MKGSKDKIRRTHMHRDIPVGNGNILITFDPDYNIRDVYFPYVGKANHSRGCISRTGIWVDGQFSWLNSPAWEKKLDYMPDTLATQVTASNNELKLKLVFNDMVDFKRDIFLRRVQVFNSAKQPREVRLFFHYSFRFWDVGRGDSIYYSPDDHVLIAYKDDCYFLINGSLDTRVGIDGWTTGYRDEQGQGGSWLDAEDGHLNEIAVSYGAVDGVIAIHQPQLPPLGRSVVYTWLAAAHELQRVLFLDSIVIGRKPEFFMKRTVNFWQAWLKKEDRNFCNLPEDLVNLYERSLLVIRTQIDNRGGIIAAIDTDVFPEAHGFETYSYVWPRDGAYIANALDKAGYCYLTSSFYKFCRDVIQREQNKPGSLRSYKESAYMSHKYTIDRLVASNWMPQVDEAGTRQLPIEEDETAIVLYTLWQHYLKYRDIEMLRILYRPLIIQSANFMVGFRDRHTRLPAPSFDIWESERGIHSYTVATVWAGLGAAANFAELFGEQFNAKKFRRASAEIKEASETYLYDNEEGRFLKQILVNSKGEIKRDYTIDASLYGLWYFGMFEVTDPRIERTMQAVIKKLWCQTPVGGIARYEGDPYYWDSNLKVDRRKIPGNSWFVCTLWIAQYHIARAQTLKELEQALPILKWACTHALPSGIMSEQVNPVTGKPSSVSPLTWSHATLVTAVEEYIEKYKVLQKNMHL